LTQEFRTTKTSPVDTELFKILRQSITDQFMAAIYQKYTTALLNNGNIEARVLLSLLLDIKTVFCQCSCTHDKAITHY